MKKERLKSQRRGLRLSPFQTRQRASIIKARKLRDEGYSFQEIAELIEKTYCTAHSYVVNDKWDWLINREETNV